MRLSGDIVLLSSDPNRGVTRRSSYFIVNNHRNLGILLAILTIFQIAGCVSDKKGD